MRLCMTCLFLKIRTVWLDPYSWMSFAVNTLKKIYVRKNFPGSHQSTKICTSKNPKVPVKIKKIHRRGGFFGTHTLSTKPQLRRTSEC